MRVLAFDPYLAATRARTLQVELVHDLDDLLPNARLHYAAHATHARDASLAQCGAAVANETRGAGHQLRARRADR
jgi:hypothetical protein